VEIEAERRKGLSVGLCDTGGQLLISDLEWIFSDHCRTV